ncbi:MAG: 6-phosphogluconolactonase [Rhodobacterales bacterium]|nr:MAG: 6-phosphogluconolactonase [Rhodobacterales bacterium]
MKIIKYPDAEMMAMDLATDLANQLGRCLSEKERVTFVVPGGRTPGPVFDVLSGVSLDWERVDVLLCDERWVGEDSSRSNTRMLRERLLVDQAANARLIPLYQPAEQPEEVVEELAQVIEPLLPIDVLLLGMGRDMHTASLFPDGDRLEAAFDPHAPILMPMRSPSAKDTRLTLTAPVLMGATITHILFTGKTKKKVLKTARKLNDPLKAPISAFLRGATVHWTP